MQLRLLREQMAAMEATLLARLDSMETNLLDELAALEGRLNTKLADLQAGVDVGNEKLVEVQARADEIYDEVTAVNIDMTTQLCFDLAVGEAYVIGGHGEFGVGWPNVLDAKAIVQGDISRGLNLGLGNQICINVPLYSVESNEPLFTNGDEFDALIAGIAMPAQTIVPLFAEIYTALMPSPAEAIQAIANVIEAATGYDIYTKTQGTADPALLLRPDIVLAPVIPPVVEDFAAAVPDLVDSVVADPCGAFASTPLGAGIDPAVYDWTCPLSATAFAAIAGTLDAIKSVVDTIKCIVDPLCF